MHVRGQIREYIRGRLALVEGLVGYVVLDLDEIPEDLEFPYAHVSIGDEDVQPFTLGGALGRKLTRELQINIDLFYRDKSEALVLAEDYCARIEAQMALDPRMGGLAQDLALRAYTISRNDEGSQPLVRMRLQWIVTYWTQERDATVPA